MAAVIDYHTGSRIEPTRTRHLQLVEASPRRSRPPAHVFLVRRLLVAGLVGLVLLIGSLGVRTVVTAASGSSGVVSTHVVRPNETLWSIAAAARPERDPRHTIAEIVRLNRANSGDFSASRVLSVGEEILIPLG